MNKIKPLEERLCYACRFAKYLHNRAGKKFYCAKQDHKITKGKLKCKEFRWR